MSHRITVGEEWRTDVDKTGTTSAQSALAVAGRRSVFFGDSITNGSIASSFATSFSKVAVDILGSAAERLDFVEAGTGGYTATQLLAYAPSVLAAYPDLGHAHIQIGTNDANLGFALGSFTAPVMSLVGLCKARGMTVTIGTVPPRAGVANSMRLLIAAYNTWIRLWAPANGIEVAEVHGALADVTTGDLYSAYDSGDGAHPNDLGHARIAQVVAQAMFRTFRTTRSSTSLLALSTGISLCANPMMAGSIGAGSPSGYYESTSTGSAPTYQILADTTGRLPAGQWYEMDWNAVSGGIRTVQTEPVVTGVNTGNTLAVTGIYLVEDITGTWEADVAGFTAGVAPSIRMSDGTIIANVCNGCPGLKLGNIYGNGNTVWQIGPLLSPAIVPSGTTGLLMSHYVFLPSGKHVKVRFGCLDVINLSALGLTSIVGGLVGSAVNLNGP